jgi:hypothetical protein
MPARTRDEPVEGAALRLLRIQADLPAAWNDDAAWYLPEPEVSPFPDEIAKATVDMREVFASWRKRRWP